MNRPAISRNLCLACGICCNGVLFKNVEVQPGDDREALESAGLVLQEGRRKTTFAQPCASLCPDNRCRIYRNRPAHCRNFECALFKDVQAGVTPFVDALVVIRSAQRKAEKVRRLLAQSGDLEESQPLRRRFRRVRERCERGELKEPAASAFADLTLAMHALNVLLSSRFYP